MTKSVYPSLDPVDWSDGGDPWSLSKNRDIIHSICTQVGDLRLLAHGSFLYGCTTCDHTERVYLCVGIEGPEPFRTSGCFIPSPFSIDCAKCGGVACHTGWYKEDQTYHPPIHVPPGSRAFALHKFEDWTEDMLRNLRTIGFQGLLFRADYPTETEKTICLDFDGVLHSYTSGWKGATTIPDPPVPGAQEAVAKLMDSGYRVAVLSARCNPESDRKMEATKAILAWLREHNFPPVGYRFYVARTKPPAHLYVDDRGFRFTGDWDVVLAFVEAGMVPWNRG